jgi:hypothetical protein
MEHEHNPGRQESAPNSATKFSTCPLCNILKTTTMRRLIIFIFSTVLFVNCTSEKEKTCLLIGKVVDRNSKTLILKKETEDSRSRDIEIQIDSSGFFKYELKFQFVEAYELIVSIRLNPSNNVQQFL